jgi:hypothetical protein
MEPSTVPLRLFSTAVRQKGSDQRIRANRLMIIGSAVLLGGIVRNMVRNASKYAGSCFRKLWRRRGGVFSQEG